MPASSGVRRSITPPLGTDSSTREDEDDEEEEEEEEEEEDEEDEDEEDAVWLLSLPLSLLLSPCKWALIFVLARPTAQGPVPNILRNAAILSMRMPPDRDFLFFNRFFNFSFRCSSIIARTAVLPFLLPSLSYPLSPLVPLLPSPLLSSLVQAEENDEEEEEEECGGEVEEEEEEDAHSPEANLINSPYCISPLPSLSNRFMIIFSSPSVGLKCNSRSAVSNSLRSTVPLPF